MAKATRLFALMDALRRHRRPVTAASLAAELSVSLRTIYRDVQTLIGLGAPIEGEAGIGYLLRPGFFLPPLMFDEDELEALVLGARWVAAQGDAQLAAAAGNAVGKIATASPRDLRDTIANSGLWTPQRPEKAVDGDWLPRLRAAIRSERKLAIGYVAESGAATERTIWPIGLAFYEYRRNVVAWCELREDFRHFRADRITRMEEAERYPKRRAELVKAWRKQMQFPERD
jgi:predicted DNA-binding transcriptional regulator YafY